MEKALCFLYWCSINIYVLEEVRPEMQFLISTETPENLAFLSLCAFKVCERVKKNNQLLNGQGDKGDNEEGRTGE